MADEIDVNNTDRYVFYHYHPSLPAAIIFIILFAISTVFHVYQIVWKRTWYFIPLAVGGVCESEPGPRNANQKGRGIDANTVVLYSRGRGIRRSCYQFSRPMGSHAIHCTKSSDTGRACPFCGLYLYQYVSHHYSSFNRVLTNAVLGRIILLVDGERYSLIPQRWLTKIFVTGDVLSFLVQGEIHYGAVHLELANHRL